MIIKKLINTCSACPAQWNAWTTEDEKLYIRYRWGGLTVSKVCNDWPDCECGYEVCGECIISESAGAELSGEMSEEDLIKILNKHDIYMHDDVEKGEDCKFYMIDTKTGESKTLNSIEEVAENLTDKDK